MELWKKIEPGRERLIYVLGMLESTGDDTCEATCNAVYQILEDMLENCMIYERPKGEPNAE